LYSAAQPMPVAAAICDIVTVSSPCSATSAAVVSRIAPRIYLVMEPAAWYVLVPLAFASLLTGIVQSLGTTWGLFRHYWVLFKLLIYIETFSLMADVAADPGSDLGVVRNPSPALRAALALLLLLVATVLAVYKPWGMTRYGQRRQHQLRTAPPRSEQPEQRTVSRP
jgi:DMSO/TMAO reductase YedYZ heme-binding membrane subunit